MIDLVLWSRLLVILLVAPAMFVSFALTGYFLATRGRTFWSGRAPRVSAIVAGSVSVLGLLLVVVPSLIS